MVVLIVTLLSVREFRQYNCTKGNLIVNTRLNVNENNKNNKLGYWNEIISAYYSKKRSETYR